MSDFNVRAGTADAKTRDFLSRVQALSIECSADAKPLLEKLLGPATIVVKNGGADPKLYMNYRLQKPAENEAGPRKLEFAAKLELTCEFTAKLAGVIAVNTHVPHFDRKLCQIIDQNPNITVDLDIAVRILLRTVRNGGTACPGDEPHPHRKTNDRGPDILREEAEDSGDPSAGEKPGEGPDKEEPTLGGPPMLAAALSYAKQHGWKSFPARMEDGKKWSWLSSKYAPGGENWGMTNDPEQLRRNFLNKKWRHLCGVGVPTGWVNRIFDIEVDTKEAHGVDGLASLSVLEAKYGKLPDTLMAESPTGSPHRIYRHPGHDIKVISRGLPGYPGVDIKGDGGMFVAPPSVRGDGKYKWLNDLPIADAPQWLIDLAIAASKGGGKGNGAGKDTGAGASMFNGQKPAAAFALHPTSSLGAGVSVEAPIEYIRAAFAVIPNDDSNKDHDWHYWNNHGLALFAATAGSDDGLAVFHAWSSKSKKKYNKQKTAEKWAAYKTCPPDRIGTGSIFYWADEASPGWDLNLGQHQDEQQQDGQQQEDRRGEADDADADNADADKEMQDLGGTRPDGLRLPPGFCLNEKGRICAFIPTEIDGKKKTPGRLLPLLMTRIKDPSLQFQKGHYGLGFAATTDKGSVQQVFLPSPHVYKPGLYTELPKRCVLFYPDDLAKAYLEQFTVKWLNKLLDEDTAIRDSGTMGWRHDEDGNIIGFVYGNALHHEDGTTIRIITSADDEFHKWYRPVGKRETWIKAARLLTGRKRPELDCLIAIGFAAPLMVFTGTTYGAILSFWGQPGTAKSTAQQVAAAVFGHPKQTRESLNSTPKSIQGRLGRTRNLAAYWDDIQDEKHQDALYQTMFVTAGGTEGGRLNPDASYKERLDWQTMLASCSNRSFVEYLTRKQKSTTAGMRRIFEIEYNRCDNEPGMINAVEASNIFAELEHNYGGIGLEYARMLAREHREIKSQVAGAINEFTEKVAGTGDESFWLGSCGVLLAGAELANRLGAELDVEAMRAHLVKAFHANREIRGSEGTEGGSYQNTEESLAAFLKFYVGGGYVLYTDQVYVRQLRNIITVVHAPEKNHPTHVQVAVDQHLIIISKREMREYLKKNEIQERGVFDGLKTYFKARETKITLGAGTVHALAQEMCFEIPVRDDQSVLYSILTARREPGASKTFYQRR